MSTLTLSLHPDCPWNCTLDDPDDFTFYDVRTVVRMQTNYTFIRNASDQVIATIRWRDVLPDMIMLADGSFMSVNSWLTRSLIPFNFNIKFKDDAGRGYTWRGNAPGLSLRLFADEDPTTPIAQYYKSYRDWQTNPPRRVPSRFEIKARAQEILDLVVISFLCLEKGRRAK